MYLVSLTVKMFSLHVYVHNGVVCVHMKKPEIELRNLRWLSTLSIEASVSFEPTAHQCGYFR